MPTRTLHDRADRRLQAGMCVADHQLEGVYGTPRQADVLDEHIMRLIAPAKDRHKHTAMPVDTLEEAERWINAGVTIIAYSSDLALLRDAFTRAATRLTGNGG